MHEYGVYSFGHAHVHDGDVNMNVGTFAELAAIKTGKAYHDKAVFFGPINRLKDVGAVARCKRAVVSLLHRENASGSSHP